MPYKTCLLKLLALGNILSASGLLNFCAPLAAPQALAQTQDNRKTAAYGLLSKESEQSKSDRAAATQSHGAAPGKGKEIRQREAQKLKNQGNVYHELGDNVKASEYLQKSLTLAREIKDRSLEGETLTDLGEAYHYLGDYPNAIKYQQQSLTIAKQIKHRKLESEALAGLGVAYLVLGDYTKALSYNQQSLALAQKIKHRPGETKALGLLGNTYFLLGKYPKALESQQQALTLARQIKDPSGEAVALVGLGNLYYALGNYDKALEYHQPSLAIARKNKNIYAQRAALAGLGNAYQALGDYDRAIKYQQQLLTLARKIKDPVGERTSLGNLGMAYYSLGDYARAIEYFQQSLKIARNINNRLGEEQALGNIGAVYLALGNYAKAINYQQQHLAIARELKDSSGESQALANLGNAYHLLKDYERAIEYHQQSLALAQEIKNRQVQALALGNLGNAYHRYGNYSKAIEYNQQRLTIAREIKDRQGEAQALNNLGLTYLALGNYDKALIFYQQALSITRNIEDRLGEGLALTNLGVTLLKSGKLVEAEKITRAGIGIWESIRTSLGKNYAYKVSIFDTQALTYRNLEEILVAQNKPKAALEIAERGRARAFVELLASRLSPKSATSSNVNPPKVHQIQQIAKEHNATLVEYSIIYDDIKVDGKPETHESKLFIWVIKPNGEVAFRQVDLKRLWQQQSNTSQSVAALLGQKLKINARAIALSVLIGSSILSIAVWYAGRGGVVVVCPTQEPRAAVSQRRRLAPWLLLGLGALTWGGGLVVLVMQRQPLAEKRNLRNASLLATLVSSTRDSIGARGRDATGAVAPRLEVNQQTRLQQLHEILIQPIADLLPANPDARVIFVPQASLFLIPFPALQDSSGKYLIEKHTILTAPAIQVVDLTRQQRQKVQQVTGSDAIVVGNPTMPSIPPEVGEPPEPLPPLPGAEKEAKKIAAMLNTQAITGNSATEVALKQQMPQARLIHLATHGLLDDFQGLGVPGAIALAPSGKNNGMFTASEMLDLKLNAELVVLSACDTGRGRITGDGIIGLSRSLIIAGVPSVLASLWSVSDDSTVSLMTEFYRNLQRDTDKARALRSAMLTTMKQYPSPFDWAAFTLIGEAD